METVHHKTSADQAYERYLEQRFFGSLNGVRFISIIAVMWHHSPARAVLDDPALFWIRGYLGVDFFFVLSGFLITTLLLREEARKGHFSLHGFYWRRILRIVPVYYLVVTAVGGYYIFLQGQTGLLDLWPYYYLFLSNFLVQDIPLLTITWSLAVEEQYYLIWPVLLTALPLLGWARPAILVALIVLCVMSSAGQLAFLGVEPVATDNLVWHLPTAGYSAILLGTLSAVILHRARGFAVLWLVLGCRMAPLAAFGILLALLALVPGALRGWAEFVIHLAMMLCLVSLVMREDHVLSKVMAWRPVARIGEISYGLYLYHLIGRHFAVEAGARLGFDPQITPWIMTALFVALSIAIAEISFRTFEAYFLRLKHTNPKASSKKRV